MDIQQIIDSLKGENDLILFDPGTGDVLIPELLNETNRFFYDVHEEAAKALETLLPKKMVEDEYNNPCCPNCGWIIFQNDCDRGYLRHCYKCEQALDWSSVEKV